MLNYKGTVCNNIFNTNIHLMDWVWYERWQVYWFGIVVIQKYNWICV